MRKIQIAICIFVLMIVICIFEHDRLSYFESQKNILVQKHSDLEKIKNEISKLDFNSLHSVNHERNIEIAIKKISKYLNNFILKTSNSESEYFFITDAEIKFLSKKEKYIYNFINDLMKIGLVDIEDIKISKDLLLNVEIKCRFYVLKKTEHSECISFGRNNKIFSDIKLFANFKAPLQYSLHCILEDRAFINDLWMKVGDKNDDFLIKEINFHYITIDDDGKIMRKRVGERW